MSVIVSIKLRRTKSCSGYVLRIESGGRAGKYITNYDDTELLVFSSKDLARNWITSIGYKIGGVVKRLS